MNMTFEATYINVLTRSADVEEITASEPYAPGEGWRDATEKAIDKQGMHRLLVERKWIDEKRS